MSAAAEVLEHRINELEETTDEIRLTVAKVEGTVVDLRILMAKIETYQKRILVALVVIGGAIPPSMGVAWLLLK